MPAGIFPGRGGGGGGQPLGEGPPKILNRSKYQLTLLI